MSFTTQGVFSARLQQRHWLLRYSVTVLIFGAVIGLALINQRYDVKLNFTIPVVFGLVATVWYCGRGPGVLLSILFQATTVIYATVPPDASYAKLWFGYISTFLLYLFLVFLISGMQHSGYTIRAQRDLLQVTLSSIGDAVVTTDTEGRVTFMNAAAERMTGRQVGDARGDTLAKVVRIVNEQTREPIADPAELVLKSGSVVELANHSLLLAADGRQIPIEDSASPIRDGEAVRGVILVMSDVTERKLAERARRETEIMHRIVEAQEGERQRIARGLHDQLGQQMTALRLKVEAIADRCGEMDGLATDLAEVKAAAVGIDRDIGFLSWELKPTELEDLGLNNALRSFVREWSRQYGIEAEFESNLPDTGGLGREAEINIYRIVQEALNNVLRHADATSVNVLLQQRKGGLVLIIEDNGKGFHIDNSQDQYAVGIGLAGMRERAALHGGILEVDTTPGAGTAIIVRLPASPESPAVGQAVPAV